MYVDKTQDTGWKTTTIRPTAVRETGVFRHFEGIIESPLKPLVSSQQYRIEGFQGLPLIEQILFQGTPDTGCVFSFIFFFPGV